METGIGKQITKGINVAAVLNLLDGIEVGIERMKAEVVEITLEQGVKASASARADLDTLRMTAHYLRAVIGD